MKPLSRRNFVKALGAGSALVAAPAAKALTPNKSVATPASGTAKNVIFLVVDGMNNGTLAIANHYLNIFENRDSHWTRLYSEGIAEMRGLQETRSANALVTDSAAASSAWGCGQRVDNRSINVSPEGIELEPILIKARKAGKKTGLVTTARITHATPAGFAANVDHRDKEDEIARQYLDRQIDVLLGGGSRHFDAEKREDKEDLWKAYEEAGYQVVKDRTSLAGQKGKHLDQRILGTFSDGHIPYSIDRQNVPEIDQATPSLREMTAIALERLESAPKGFVLQVEAARVDHAAHNNDVGSILHEQLEFDAVIGDTVQWARKHPDTLVIITTDHGTGGCMLCGAGKDYLESLPRFRQIQKWNTSYERARGLLQELESADELPGFIEKHFGLSVAEEDLKNAGELFAEAKKWNWWPLMQALNDLTMKSLAIGWNTGNHTGDLVELAAFGPGAREIPAFIENYQLHNLMLGAMKIKETAAQSR